MDTFYGIFINNDYFPIFVNTEQRHAAVIKLAACSASVQTFYELFHSECFSAVPGELKRYYPGPAHFWDTLDLWTITSWPSGQALVMFSLAGQCKAQLILSFITTTVLTHRDIKG